MKPSLRLLNALFGVGLVVALGACPTRTDTPPPPGPPQPSPAPPSPTPPPPAPPAFDLNAQFDTVYLASQGFQDAARTQAVADGQPVSVIRDVRGNKDLTWTTSRSNPAYQVSPIWGVGAPRFHSDEAGGYIFLPNVSETYWSSQPFAEIPQPYEAYVVLRDMEAVTWEGYFAIGFGLRNRGDQLEYGIVTYGDPYSVAVYLKKPTVLEYNKRSIVHLRVDGANSGVWINNVPVPMDTQPPQGIPTQLPTNGLRVLGYGTNSHVAQHDFYGMWVKFGSLSDSQNRQIYDTLSARYNPGAYPSAPLASAIRAVGNTASPRQWTASYQFVSPAGATEDTARTQYQWGYFRFDGGQDLNTTNYFTGAFARNRTISRSDVIQEVFGGQDPGLNKFAVFVTVKVYDTLGNSWSHVVRSPLAQDNY